MSMDAKHQVFLVFNCTFATVFKQLNGILLTMKKRKYDYVLKDILHLNLFLRYVMKYLWTLFCVFIYDK